MKYLTAALTLTALSGAAAVNIQVMPLPFETLSLGGGLYQLYDQPGLRVTAYSEQPLAIASDPQTPGQMNVDLDALPSDTQQIGPGQYTVRVGSLTLNIQSDRALTITPPTPTPQPQLIHESRGVKLSTFPGLPSEVTGSLNIIETASSVVFSYSLINLGNKSYTLDADDLSVRQSGHNIGARLERRSGNLTPGILSPGKGEIGRITVAKASSAPLTLIWTLRSGDTSFTLKRDYSIKP